MTKAWTSAESEIDLMQAFVPQAVCPTGGNTCSARHEVTLYLQLPYGRCTGFRATARYQDDTHPKQMRHRLVNSSRPMNTTLRARLVNTHFHGVNFAKHARGRCEIISGRWRPQMSGRHECRDRVVRILWILAEIHVRRDADLAKCDPCQVAIFEMGFFFLAVTCRTLQEDCLAKNMHRLMTGPRPNVGLRWQTL